MSESMRVSCPACHRDFEIDRGHIEKHFVPGRAVPCEGSNVPVARKVGHFDICKRMALENADIRVSPLDNISNLSYNSKRRGTTVTIGVDGDLVAAIGIENKYVGGLLLINREQYFATKAKMEAE